MPPRLSRVNATLCRVAERPKSTRREKSFAAPVTKISESRSTQREEFSSLCQTFAHLTKNTNMETTSTDKPRKLDTIGARIFIGCASSLITLAIVTGFGSVRRISLIDIIGGVSRTDFDERLKRLEASTIHRGAIVRLGTEQTDLYLSAAPAAKAGEQPVLYGNDRSAKTEWWILDVVK